MISHSPLRLAILATAATLVACTEQAPPSPSPAPPEAPPPAPAADTYRATGTEPFWGVAIGGGLIVLTRPDQPEASVPAPVARPTFNGRRYETAAFTVDITRSRCADAMSGAAFTDRVQVELKDGKVLHGCGGDPLPPEKIRDTQWIATEMAGQPIASTDEAPAPALSVAADGTMSGNSGCNQYRGGGVLAEGGTLTARPVMSTRMACADEVRTRHEAQFQDLLSHAQSWHYEGATLVIVAGNQTLKFKQTF